MSMQKTTPIGPPNLNLYTLISKIYFVPLFNILYPPSQHILAHKGDQAGSAHTVMAQAFPIPSGGECLVDGVGPVTKHRLASRREACE